MREGGLGVECTLPSLRLGVGARLGHRRSGGRIEPLHELVADELRIELVVGLAGEGRQVANDDQAGIVEHVGDLLQELELAALVRVRQEEEVDLVPPALTRAEHLLHPTLVAAVTVGDKQNQGAFLLDRRRRRRRLLIPATTEGTGEESALPGRRRLIAVRQPAEVTQVGFQHIAVVRPAAVARHLLDDFALDVALNVRRSHRPDMVNALFTVREGEDVDLAVGVERDPPRDQARHQIVRHPVTMLVIERAGHVHVHHDLGAQPAQIHTELRQRQTQTFRGLLNVQLDGHG